MNTVEFAVKDDTLYAIDFLNPAPDFDNFSIKEENFGWVLDRMTDLVLRYARGEAQPPWHGAYRWWRYVKEQEIPPPYPPRKGEGEIDPARKGEGEIDPARKGEGEIDPARKGEGTIKQGEGRG
jgi:hypothetical protein